MPMGREVHQSHFTENEKHREPQQIIGFPGGFDIGDVQLYFQSPKAIGFWDQSFSLGR